MKYTTEVYESEFLSLVYNPNTNILSRHWKNLSEKMNNNEFKNEMLALLDSVKQYQPQGLLGDTYNFHFVILPDVQEWCDNQVYSKFSDFGVKKMTMVNSLDYYAKLSVEQAITESPKSYEVSYFGSKEEALVWLKQ